MKQVRVAFLLTDGFEETEFVVCRDVLLRAGINSTMLRVGTSHHTLVKTNPLLVESSLGLFVRCDYLFSSDHDWSQYDGLIIPGGTPAVLKLIADPVVLKQVRWFYDQKKIIGAICAGPLVLRAAQIVNSQHMTSFPGVATKFKTNPNYSLKYGTVVDRQHNWITSQALGTAFGFSLALVEQLLGSNVRVLSEPKLIIRSPKDIATF